MRLPAAALAAEGVGTPGFGLDAGHHRALFGNDAQGGTLARRRQLLDLLIARREERLAGVTA